MKLFSAAIISLFFSSVVLGQSNDAAISDIKVKYKNIRAHLAGFDTTMKEIWDESTEGGHAIAYYDKNNTLKLIAASWFGETGKRITEYYFDNGILIFVIDQSFSYNRPIYWDEKRAKEMGDTATFDPNKTTIEEERYYFKNEELFLWLDNDAKAVDLTLGTNTIAGQGLIAHAYKMRGELKKR